MNWQRKSRIEVNYNNALQRFFSGIYNYILDGNLEKLVKSTAFKALANAIASKMVVGVAIENEKTWREAARKGMKGRKIFEALQSEMKGPLGYKMQEMISENAKLIKTFPLQVSEKVTEFVTEQQQKGVRASAIADMLKEKYQDATEARINLIARTEVSKASCALTEVRAKALGINWYIWRTSEDARVRESHDLMDDVLINWDNPPAPEELAKIKSSLGKYHAGNCPNCRCYPEPIIDINTIKFPCKVYYINRIVKMNKQEFLQIAA